MRFAVMLACFVAFSLTASAAERDRSLLAGGLTRTYTLIAPDKIKTLLPLLIVYHGGGQTAKRARRTTRFDERAIGENFVVVYPQGLDNNWNDGRVSTDLRQRASAEADDVEFTLQIIAALEVEGIIDPARVFLTGASNGGMMAMRAACELGDRIAGIAPVVANLPVDWQCRAKRMPALFIHGTDDDYMPFVGGQVAATKTKRDLGTVLSVDDTIAAFKRINACTSVKETKTVDTVGRDQTKAVITDYVCTNAPLKHIVIEGGGHTWPGARESIIGELLLGKTSQDIDATAEIWTFFKSLPAR
ncbi:MAG: PHB depolymerase family esterase [Micropepsaceae bacterium]